MVSKTSLAMQAEIKKSEGLRLTAYLCPRGIPTIGYGHTKSVTANDVGKKKITKDEAERLFQQDILEHEEVLSVVKVPLTQGQIDAIVDLAFNMGVNAVRSSTLLRLVNAKKYNQGPLQLRRWVKAVNPKTGRLEVLDGLVKRREMDVQFWNGVNA